MAKDKKLIRFSDLQKKWKDEGYTQHQLAEEYGVSVGTIRNILKAEEDREVTPRERRASGNGAEPATKGRASMPHTLRAFLKETRRHLAEYGVTRIELDVESGECHFDESRDVRLGT